MGWHGFSKLRSGKPVIARDGNRLPVQLSLPGACSLVVFALSDCIRQLPVNGRT